MTLTYMTPVLQRFLICVMRLPCTHCTWNYIAHNLIKQHEQRQVVKSCCDKQGVLVSAGIELIFFLVAGTVCFGFSVRIMLITR